MILSESFTLREFTFSETAARMGREVEPTVEQVENATRLCRTVLQPMREALNRPIVISSGIRPDWLNRAIGGAPNSAHMTGRAADLNVVGMSPLVVARWIRVQNRFPVDRVICEFNRWVHVQIAAPGNAPRNQFFTARHDGGKVVYEVLS